LSRIYILFSKITFFFLHFTIYFYKVPLKVLLTTLNAKYIHINLAIRELYALNKHHAGLQWKEFTINEPQQPVAEHCAQFDVVAFSCYIWNITQTLKVATQIKAINTNTKIMLGGPEVSYEWQPVIQHEAIDYIVIGEGEIPFATFLTDYPNVQNVPSLVRKENGDVYFNPLETSFDVANFENIQPYIYDEPKALFNKVAYIETSRGCPYKCEFCLASLDNKVRYLPDAHIKETLLYLMNHGKVIKFLDRTFNIKKDFTIDIFKFILKHRKPGNVFQFEITADIVHKDIIAFIQEHVPVGLFRFEIGIQTVNQKANLEVSRKQNFEKTKGVIEQLKNKIEMHLDLIVGLPLDEFDDIKYSIEEVFKLFPPELQLGFLKFLKGTPMRHKVDAHEYVYDPKPPYQIIKSKYLSEAQLAQITIVENALEIYWNKNRTKYTLQYIATHYSIFDFFLGLGNHFLQSHTFHQFGLQDVYTIIYKYAEVFAPQDAIMQELIAIDYALQYKVKPKVLFAQEIEKKVFNQYCHQHHLPYQQFRFGGIQISFDFDYFVETNLIKASQEIVVIQYNGVEKAKVWKEEVMH
jgi:anaerobic magnesium-protoporphyrin IX monomethyl ester cyclase